jgi:hypothetical protein
MTPKQRGNVVKVYISNTLENAAVAEALSRGLKVLSDNVQTFQSSYVRMGSEFRDTISRELDGSDYLIQIVGDPTSIQSTWQGFELGYYLAKKSVGQVIMIIDPALSDHVSAGLDNAVQVVRATSTELNKLIHQFADAIGAPIADAIAAPNALRSDNAAMRAEAEATSATIAQKFVGGIATQVVPPTMTISLDETHRDGKESIASAPIHANPLTLSLLNLPEGNWTLEDVKMHQADRSWINEIIENIAAITRSNQLPKSMEHFLRTDRGPYLPVLYHIETGTGRGLSVTVAFIKWRGETSAPYEEYRTALEQFQTVAPYEQSIFVMTKYPNDDLTKQTDDDRKLRRVINVIRDSIAGKGCVARLASDKPYHHTLWNNIEIYLLGCFKGVAIVENKYGQNVNPNVAMEWGWMRLIPLSQVDQYLGLADRIRNGAGFGSFGRS